MAYPNNTIISHTKKTANHDNETAIQSPTLIYQVGEAIDLKSPPDWLQ
jgi:hypothetical protein